MINPIYLKKNVFGEVQKEFQNKSILKLEDFFTKETYSKISQSSRVAGQRSEPQQIPSRRSEATIDEQMQLTVSIFYTPQVKDFIFSLTNKQIKQITLKKLSHKEKEQIINPNFSKKQIRFFLFICEKKDPDQNGNIVFTTKENKTFFVTPFPNAIAFIKKQENWKNEFQYLNQTSKQKEVVFIEGICD